MAAKKRVMGRPKLKMDKLGYFTIKIFPSKREIGIRFHDYDGEVKEILYAKNSKTLYISMIQPNQIFGMTEMRMGHLMQRDIQMPLTQIYQKQGCNAVHHIISRVIN